jgi:hypothetical protein
MENCFVSVQSNVHLLEYTCLIVYRRFISRPPNVNAAARDLELSHPVYLMRFIRYEMHNRTWKVEEMEGLELCEKSNYVLR